MIQKNFDLALRKGAVGEAVVVNKLEQSGFVVYQPKTAGAHCFDILAIKDKSRCVSLDVKAKSRRNKYADTGINQKHYETYLRFSKKHSMPFWVVFVDEWLKSIYGNTIEELDKERSQGKIKYPFVWNGIRFYPLCAMITIGSIDTQDAETLIGLSRRNYGYRLDTGQ